MNSTKKLNTQTVATWLPVFPGFYNTLFEVDFDSIHYYERDYLKENYFIDNPKKFPFWDKFDNSEYMKKNAESCCDFIHRELSDFIEKIELEKISSPREYNFYNDSIHCKISVYPGKIAAYIYENKKAFSEYLKNNYTSRSGFISIYSNNFEDWQTDTDNFTDFSECAHQLGAILNFICDNEDSEMYMSMYEYCNERIYVSEFLDYSELQEIVDFIENFTQQNYLKGGEKIISELTKKYEDQEIYVNIEKAVNHFISEIERHTLNLFEQ